MNKFYHLLSHFSSYRLEFSFLTFAVNNADWRWKCRSSSPSLIFVTSVIQISGRMKCSNNTDRYLQYLHTYTQVNMCVHIYNVRYGRYVCLPVCLFIDIIVTRSLTLFLCCISGYLWCKVCNVSTSMTAGRLQIEPLERVDRQTVLMEGNLFNTSLYLLHSFYYNLHYLCMFT